MFSSNLWIFPLLLLLVTTAASQAEWKPDNSNISQHIPNKMDKRKNGFGLAIGDSNSGIALKHKFLRSDPCLEKTILYSCLPGATNGTRSFTRFSYNATAGRCQRVPYTGCGAGRNLFDSANDCTGICKHRLAHMLPGNHKCQNPYANDCVDLSANSGRSAFFYDERSGRCLAFTAKPSCRYFSTDTECQKACAPSESMLQNRCLADMTFDDTCSIDRRTTLWFYEPTIRQCLSYSSCPLSTVGRNAFSTKCECLKTCFVFSVEDVCRLPKDVGVRSNYGPKAKYFFNSQRNRCELFFHEGGLGNANRFTDKRECEMFCSGLRPSKLKNIINLRTPLEPRKLPLSVEFNRPQTKMQHLNRTAEHEYCFDPPSHGTCKPTDSARSLTRFFYNPRKKECEKYSFAGCGSISRNIFETLQACDGMCTSRFQMARPPLCFPEPSNCTISAPSHVSSWRYNSDNGQCETYSLCMNSALDSPIAKELCQRLCVAPLIQLKDLYDVCQLPPTIDNKCGDQLVTRWIYDANKGTCWSASTCAIYGNNFDSESSCMRACEPQSYKEVCSLPVDAGPCHKFNHSRFHYDSASKACKKFRYGGCLGNRNRFMSGTECKRMCGDANAGFPAQRTAFLTLTGAVFMACLSVKL